MAKAGFCAQCGANVWLAEDGGCHKGHPADQVSGVYQVDPPKDSLSEAGQAIENAAKDVGGAVQGAWKDAEPAASEAAEAAGEATRKAAGAAMSFGKKLFGAEEPEAPVDDGSVEEPTPSSE